MADRTTRTLLDGLSRAVADTSGAPLYSSKTSSGLFSSNTAGRQAAQRCKEEGFLRVIGTEPRGKTPVEVCAITEKGLGYLLANGDPRQVVEDFIRTLEARHTQAGELLLAARQMQTSLDLMKANAELVLHALTPGSVSGAAPATNGSAPWSMTLLHYLEQRRMGGGSADCPLPELYQHAQHANAGLSLGQFHDGLRTLHAQGKLYLHPWTGPLHEMPEPSCAMLIGHEIAYYASLRLV